MTTSTCRAASGVRWALTAALAFAALPAACQQDPFRDETVAIRARRIETVSDGVIENGIILIRNGKITSAGRATKIPVGARVITADTVMPGIVGAFSQIGLSAPGGGGPVQLPANIPPQFAARFQGLGGARASANTHYRVLDELYPFEEAYSRLPRAGVTTLGLVPDGRGFTGQGAVIKLGVALINQGSTERTEKMAGGALINQGSLDKVTGGALIYQGSPEKMALAQTSPLGINFAQDTATQDLIRSTLQGGGGTGGGPGGGGGGRGGGFGGGASAESDTAPAADDASEDDPFQRGRGRQIPRPGGFAPNAPSALTAAARRLPVTRAVAGEIPTFIECADAASTTYALTLFQAFDKLKPVYVLAADSYRIADLLGQKKASVIVPADLTFEPNTRNRVNTPAILAKAGVKVACRPSGDSVNGYDGLLMKMSELVKNGLDRETALKAITLHPAEMLGVQERVGSIQFGRDGNLILLDGDPFSPLTKVTQVLVEGKTVYDGK